jgi:hypothetical protein
MFTFGTVDKFLVVNRYAKKSLFMVPSNRVRSSGLNGQDLV